MDQENKLHGHSNIFLDREGRWFHEGVQVTHERTVAMFFRSLSKGPDGRYVLRVGRETAVVDVEDTPFLVLSVTVCTDDSGSIEAYRLLLNDDTEEDLDPATLTVEADGIPYCRVKGGADKARFKRPAYYQLCAHVQPGAGEGLFVLPLRDGTVPIPSPDRSTSSGE